MIFVRGDPEPGERSARFVREQLRAPDALRPPVHRAPAMRRPDWAYWSVPANDRLALLNFGDDPATLRLSDGRTVQIVFHSFRLETSR